MSLPTVEDDTPTSKAEGAPPVGGRRTQSLKLATPSSCASAAHKYALTPTTPDPARNGFRIDNDDGLDVIFFDFDGTLTATPGDQLQRWEKKAELRSRAPMLSKYLQVLRGAGLTLAIISKSTAQTIQDSLQDCNLSGYFNGPVIGNAVGFEGKAGFIKDAVESGTLRLGPEGLQRVLLIDDDVRELVRAREHGIQTYAAPQTGGLQESDFDDIFESLSLPSPGDEDALDCEPEATEH